MNLLQKFYIGEVELYGEKDIYSYFNLINEKFESNVFNSSDLEGSIMSTEPLTYKIRSNTFPNNSPQIPIVWKTSINVILQKKGSGTLFSIYPKTGTHTWITYTLLVLFTIINLINGTFFKQTGDIVIFLIAFTIIYLIDRFAKQRLVSDFKEQILYK